MSKAVKSEQFEVKYNVYTLHDTIGYAMQVASRDKGVRRLEKIGQQIADEINLQARNIADYASENSPIPDMTLRHYQDLKRKLEDNAEQLHRAAQSAILIEVAKSKDIEDQLRALADAIASARGWQSVETDHD